jgi:hypothetical protein
MNMKMTLLILVIVAVSNVLVAGDTAPTVQEKADAQRLRAVLPKMVLSSDTALVHQALLIVRDDLFQNRSATDEVLSNVVTALKRLLKERRDEDGASCRLACQVLGRSKYSKATTVLIEALEDPYLHTDFTPVPGVGGAHMEWSAVWRDADHALREITEASPVDEPRQRDPIDGQREKVRDAWLKWFKTNAEQASSNGG